MQIYKINLTLWKLLPVQICKINLADVSHLLPVLVAKDVQLNQSSA